MDELHGLSDNSNGILLLTVLLMSSDHDHVSQSLDDGALDLLEPTLLVAASGVGDVDLLLRGLDLQVSTEGNVWALINVVAPLSEKFWLKGVFWSVFALLGHFTQESNSERDYEATYPGLRFPSSLQRM